MFIIEKLIAFVIGGTWLTFLIGSWHVSLTILLVFMAIDFITGIIKGAYTGKLRSSVGYKGILRKGTIMLVIVFANMLDLLTGTGLPVFRTMIVFFYIGNEGLSIIENLGAIGVPVPAAITKYIEQLSKEELPTNRKD